MIFSRADCYSLLIDALDRVVTPQLQTPEPQAVVAVAIQTLKDLARLDDLEPAAHAQAIPQGALLGRQAIAVLKSLAPHRAAEHAQRISKLELQHEDPRGGSAEALRYTFNTLLTILDGVARDLLDHREAAAAGDLSTQLSTSLRSIAEWELRHHQATLQPHAITPRVPRHAAESFTREIVEARLRSVPDNPPDLEVTRFDALTGGMSKVTVMISTRDSVHGTRDMVVRKDDPKYVFNFDNFRLANEFALLRRVNELGLPVVEPYWFFKADAQLSADFYVMEKAAGKVAGNVYSGDVSGISEKLLLNLAAYLARQHALTLNQFEDYIRKHDNPLLFAETTEQCVRRYVMKLRGEWDKWSRLHSPGEAHTLNWLLANVPRNDRPPSLVHSDCTLHNLLAIGNDISAVMDWECAHFGDPAEDLAYIRGIVSRFMNWHEFLQHYRECGGREIEESSLDFYQCLANFRNYSGTNRLLTLWYTGERADIRALPMLFNYFPSFIRDCVEATLD